MNGYSWCQFHFLTSNGKFTSFQTMAPRHHAEEELLGDPESVLSTQWFEAVFSGANTDGIISWAFKNRPQLPTNQQVWSFIKVLYEFFGVRFFSYTSSSASRRRICRGLRCPTRSTPTSTRRPWTPTPAGSSGTAYFTLDSGHCLVGSVEKGENSKFWNGYYFYIA